MLRRQDFMDLEPSDVAINNYYILLLYLVILIQTNKSKYLSLHLKSYLFIDDPYALHAILLLSLDTTKSKLVTLPLK